MKLHVIVILEEGLIEPDPLLFTSKKRAQAYYDNYILENHLDPEEPYDDYHEIHWFQGIIVNGMGTDIEPWTKKLTAKERKHLKEMDITTLEKFKSNRTYQGESRKKYKSEPCYTCRRIADKLNIKEADHDY